MYQNPYQQMSYTRQNGIQWVQGIEGAKAFQLMPNSNTVLLDSENDVFYIKTCDNIGMCNLRIFKYDEITDIPKQSHEPDLSQFVTRQEVEEMIQSIKSLGGNNNVKQSVQSAKQSNSSPKQ